MQQALDRISDTLLNYKGGSLSRSVASIELVSAFTVILRRADVEPADMQTAIGRYIDAILTHVDGGEYDVDAVIAEVTRVYESARNKDADVLSYISQYK